MSSDSSVRKAGSLSPLPVPKEKDTGEESSTYRRLLGLVLGTALGLTFGLVSQYGNVLLVLRVPLYQPPLGGAGNLLVCVAVGAVVGLVAAWPRHPIVGAIAGSATGALLVEIAIMVMERDTLDASKATVTLFTFLPIAAIVALPVGLVRWVLSKEEVAHREGALGDRQAQRQNISVWRVIRPLLLVLIAAAWGALFIYPARGRAVLPRMNAIVQAGLNAADRAALPAEFQAIDVPGYPQQAKGAYTLDWQGDRLGRFAIPRPIHNEEEQSAVIARFENGWSFVCLFVTVGAEPQCAPLYVEP
jgi:hypothetical protein